MKQLIVGTANFNSEYGINNFKFKYKYLKYDLFKYLKQKKLNYFDSSFNYNLNNEFINNLNFKGSKIITKFSLPKRNKRRFLSQIYNEISNKINIFKIPYFEAILLHDIYDLKTKLNKEVVKILRKLKKEGLVKKIGVSIYSPEDLQIVFSNFQPDIIQAPINIFDSRLINSKWMKTIEKKKIDLQARSIFLQGLLLTDLRKLSKKKISKNLIFKINELEKWCQENNISRLEACLGFINSLKTVKFITVGICSKEELCEILNILNRKRKIKLKDFSVKNNKLIDPRKWKIN